MKYSAASFSKAGPKYLGQSYSKMDCQKFVETCMSDVGLHEALAGSNAWYRQVMHNGWVGSPEDCKKQFGEIPKGALLFILAHDGKEPAKYQGDGIGNASHIGIYTGLTGQKMVSMAMDTGNNSAASCDYGDGAIHSSQSRGCVATSKFTGKSINGGWNRIGLYNRFTYGKSIDWIMDHGGDSPDDPGGGGEEKPMQGTVDAPTGSTVNLRKTTGGDLLERIPIGSPVTILDYGADWCKVSTCGYTGYMMTQYIKLDEDQGSDDQGEGGSGQDADPGGEYVTVSRKQLQRIYDEIGDLLGLRGDDNGVG